ncbi:YetF domain-containing protein [Bacillus suaedaesalsae]|uniref:DUF421 domain-containing protein n=1 Tax=Bacillus suaedaesalsae TaxID=2810349 RepID=A0ABS2DCW5_9BACI|nr:DUF421 domain-containing protein [Bacillus suaedaesalsae]MBM6616299.1 DUF421 domain-containing protein [Bacillus suaedaesalsae]
MGYIGQITVELVVGLLALLVATKIVGKTQISQLTPFDFISAIVLGELVGNALYDSKIHVWSILYAIAMWTLLIYIILIITQKFRSTRTFLEGNPAILIRNGVIDREQLRLNKLDINELQQLLRQEKDIFSLREVEFAILEPNGQISAMKKPRYVNPTVQDLGLQQKKVFLPISLINDGVIDYDNLKTSGYDEQWLRDQLIENGINRAEDVLFADWIEEEGFFYQKKEPR